SYDSKSIAFLSDGKLRRIDASGGPVLVLCDASATPPGTWGRDDVIVFSGGLRGPLSRVAASGGTPVRLTASSADPSDRLFISPWLLPDGRHFLFTAGAGASRQMTLFV